MDFLEYFIKMFFNWPGGTILAVVVFFCFVAVLGILIWIAKLGIYEACDSWFLKPKYGVGRAINKEAIPAQLRYAYPPIYHYLPQYFLTIEVLEEGKCGSVLVGKELYYQISIGGWLPVSYIKGRFSGSIYIKPRL